MFNLTTSTHLYLFQTVKTIKSEPVISVLDNTQDWFNTINCDIMDRTITQQSDQADTTNVSDNNRAPMDVDDQGWQVDKAENKLWHNGPSLSLVPQVSQVAFKSIIFLVLSLTQYWQLYNSVWLEHKLCVNLKSGVRRLNP